MQKSYRLTLGIKRRHPIRLLCVYSWTQPDSNDDRRKLTFRRETLQTTTANGDY